MNNFRVSVITPVYNAEKYLRKAVESAVALEEVGEVILIEDKSPDNALDLCYKLANEHKKVSVYQHPDGENHGAGASRNLGIEKSRFDYLAFLDADDWYLPNRFIKDKEIFENDNSIDGVYGALGIYYYSEKAKKQFFDGGFKSQEFFTLNKPVPHEKLVYVLLGEQSEYKGSFSTDCVTLRKTVFDKVGVFNARLKLQQDLHLWIRAAAKCKLVAGEIVQPIAIRGVHENNRMTNRTNQVKYREQRWDDLNIWFHNEVKDIDIINCFEEKYLLYKSRVAAKRKSLLLLIKYILYNPYKLKEKYGVIDLVIFQIGKNSLFSKKIVSIKHKILK